MSRRALAGGTWIAALAVAAAAGPPGPVPAAGAALAGAALAAGIGGRAPALAAALLLLGAAPLLAGWPGGLLLGAAALGGVGLVAGGGALPRAVGLGVAGAGATVWLRAAFAEPGAGWSLAAPVRIGAVALLLGGLCAGLRPGRRAAGGLAVAGLVLGLRASLAGAAPPASPSEVDRLLASGLERRHLAALCAAPRLGLLALAARPAWHELGRCLAAARGPFAPLDAGWRPEGAALPPDARIAVARALDLRGRGGEGLRLLRAGADDPRVAWWAALFAREQGEEPPEAGLSGEPPPEALVLPGPVSPRLVLAPGEKRDVLLHLAAPAALRLAREGAGPEPWTARLDARPAVPVGTGEEVVVAHRLAPGPHRLALRAAEGGAAVLVALAP